MRRGSLYKDDYSPQLTGHETFPLRYGWLKKAFDAVLATEGGAPNRWVFAEDDAIARFGVGKNMVASIRHWAKAAGVLEEMPSSGSIATTDLGRLLFGQEGLDPYMENPATSWIVHWHLSGGPDKTTWHWAFSYYPAATFSRNALAEALEQLARERNWKRASAATIKRDVTCFVRTYVAQLWSSKTDYEDVLESPLTELGLISPLDRQDHFQFVQGPKPTLGLGAFGYAVTDFWNSQLTAANTLSFELLALAPGSPGRVFLLEENDVAEMLAGLEAISGGVYRWSESAGLKQLSRTVALPQIGAMKLLSVDYDRAYPKSSVP